MPVCVKQALKYFFVTKIEYNFMLRIYRYKFFSLMRLYTPTCCKVYYNFLIKEYTIFWQIDKYFIWKGE